MRFHNGLWHYKGRSYTTLRAALLSAWDRARQKEAPASAGNTDKGEAELVATTVSTVIIPSVKEGCQA